MALHKNPAAISAASAGTALLLSLVGTGPAAAVPESAAPTRSTAASPCADGARFDPARFTNPTRIDNRFLPLVPGTRFVFEGTSSVTGEPLDHRVVFTVTDLTKVIAGVRTRVVLDQDLSEGALTEQELAFFAQDKDGNVWSLGEYPEEFEDGEFLGAPNTWIPGVDGARAGVVMLAQPRVGTPEYLQGFSPTIDFLDCARVFQTGQRVCVPVACYRDVLVTEERSPLEPDSGKQRKFYAPGVGNIQITAVDDPEGETLALTKVGPVNDKELKKVRKQALKLEKRAYRISAVYGHTPPMTQG